MMTSWRIVDAMQLCHRLARGFRQTILGQIWPYLKPERRRLWMAVGVSMAYTAVEVSGPILIGSAVDGLLDALHAQMPTAQTLWTMRWIALAWLALAVARGVLLTVQRGLAGRIGEQVASHMRRALWYQVQAMPVDRVEVRGAGRLLVRFISDARAVQRLVTEGMLNTTHELFIAAVLIVGLLAINWRMGAIVALIIPIYAVLFHRENPRLQKASRARRRRRSRLSAYLVERIAGLSVVKAFSRQDAESKQFARLTRKLANRGARVATIGGRMQGSAAGIATFAGVLVLIVAAGEAEAGRLTVGQLVAFYTVLGMVLPILRQVVIANRYLQEAHISVERLSQTLAEPTEATSDALRPSLHVKSGDVRVIGVSSHQGDRKVLDRVHLCARRGELVAIVGPNGAGKSTLLELLLRFRALSSGCVLVDGQDISRVKLASLRAQIGFVSSAMPLFDDTLRNNVLYGALPQTSEQQIERAIRIAGADRVADALPGGWEARVGESGRLLSSGQRQRIALARALVLDPPILVLDEAASALDAEAEQQLAESLRRLAHTKTLIVAAHRLPTLQLADRIYVLKNGRVVEQGTHHSLLNNGGVYAQLFGAPGVVPRH